MLKKEVISFGLLGFLFVAFCCAVLHNLSQQKKKIVLIFSDHNTIGSTLNLAAERFKKSIEEKTAGRVEIRYFPASQLGDERANIEAVQLGIIDMCFADTSYLSNLDPEFGVMDLPYIFTDWADVERVQDGRVGELLQSSLLEKNNLRILGWFHVGFRDMVSAEKPIRFIDDFKGMKFRSPESSVFVNMFRAIGACATPVPWGEVYCALKTKLVDGMETTPEGMVQQRIYEVADYLIQTQHINSSISIIINEDSYRALPEDIQQIIIETVDEVKYWQRKALIEANEQAYQYLENHGMKIIKIDIDAMRNACKPIWHSTFGNIPDAEKLIEMIQNDEQKMP